MTTEHPDEDAAFGAVDHDELDFGTPALDADQDAFFTSGDFAQRVERAAVEDRLAHDRLLGGVPPQASAVPPTAPVVLPVLPATGRVDAVDFGPGTVAVPVRPHEPPPVPPRRRGRRWLGILLVLLLLVAGGAAAAYHFGVFGAPGAQPESVVPADALAFGDVDLNPAAGQKLAAFRLARKFPSVDAGSPDDLKRSVLVELLEDAPYGVSYDDVRPWIGDRVAFAVVPAPGTEDGISPLLVVQVSDRAAAEEALVRMKRQLAGSSSDPSAGEPDDLAYAFRDDFVLFSDDQAEVDAAAAAPRTLEDDDTFTTDMARLEGDQVATLWADVGRTYDAVPEQAKAEIDELFAESPRGSMVFGAHVDASYVEVTGHVAGVAGGLPTTMDTSPGTGLIERLPADATVALAATGLGDGVMGAYEEFAALDVFGLASSADTAGLRMPEDLAAVLGQEVAAAVRMDDAGDSPFVMTARTEEADAATRALETVFGRVLGVEDLQTQVTADGYVAGSDATWTADVVGGRGGLGQDASFVEAVPGAASANAAYYMDIAELLEVWGEEEAMRDLAPLQSFGASFTGDAERLTLTARLTVR